MKKTLHRLFVSSLASFMTLVMITQPADIFAQDRPGRGGPAKRERRERPATLGNHNRPSVAPQPSRPGNRPSKPDQPSKPSKPTPPANNNHNNWNQGWPTRPGHNNGDNRPGNDRPGNRPGNNRPGDRPGNRPGGNRPGNDWRPDRPGNNRPGGNWRPDYRPGPPPGAWRPAPPPPRPHRPGLRPWRPPVPPPAWRPQYAGPSFATVLGVALGTALYSSVNALISEGYNVDGYQDGVVYLRDLNQFNYFWPDAMLRYDNGMLIGSEYLYTTPGYDMSRYSGLYNYMFARYGMPAISGPSATPGGLASTWFGGNNCYITITYAPVNLNGIIRYCTSVQQGRY